MRLHFFRCKNDKNRTPRSTKKRYCTKSALLNVYLRKLTVQKCCYVISNIFYAGIMLNKVLTMIVVAFSTLLYAT